MNVILERTGQDLRIATALRSSAKAGEGGTGEAIASTSAGEHVSALIPPLPVYKLRT